MSYLSHYPPRQKGFTLIEVVIFMVVVAIGISTLMKVSSTVLTNSAESTLRIQAIAVADASMNEYMNMPLSTLAAMPGQITDSMSIPSYSSKIELTPCPSCMKIRVTVERSDVTIALFAVKY